jgi:hypothetical protein
MGPKATLLRQMKTEGIFREEKNDSGRYEKACLHIRDMYHDIHAGKPLSPLCGSMKMCSVNQLFPSRMDPKGIIYGTSTQVARRLLMWDLDL